MQIISSKFANQQIIPSDYTCDGRDVNPPLEFKEVPENTKSLVLIMDDPDAMKPAGKVWDHWIIFNIPPDIRTIREGEEPLGVHGLGTSNNLKYHGPCPPDGQHRYIFKLYALDTSLDLPQSSTKGQLEQAVSGHILAQAELVGLYQRR
ncbi:MAG: YbhB/YbcL family Raf kinase inhibitor-like protein [Patescibacteria group bacterium]